MDFLKEIDGMFLLNDTCKNEIQNALQYFCLAILDANYHGANTFVLEKDDDDNYCYKLVAARIGRNPDRYAIELTKKGFLSHRGNERYMTITSDGILIKNQRTFSDSLNTQLNITQEIKYQKTNSGFTRSSFCMTCENKTFSKETISTITTERQNSVYAVKGLDSLETSRIETEKKTRVKNNNMSDVDENTLKMERDLVNIQMVYVSTNEVSFVSQTQKDTIPDYQTLFIDRIKDIELHPKEKKIQKKLVNPF